AGSGAASTTNTAQPSACLMIVILCARGIGVVVPPPSSLGPRTYTFLSSAARKSQYLLSQDWNKLDASSLNVSIPAPPNRKSSPAPPPRWSCPPPRTGTPPPPPPKGCSSPSSPIKPPPPAPPRTVSPPWPAPTPPLPDPPVMVSLPVPSGVNGTNTSRTD